MMSLLLEKLFAAPGRIRLLKLFLMNPEARFSAAEALRRSRLARRAFDKTLKEFERLEVIQSEVRRTAEADGRNRRRGRSRIKQKPRGNRERVYSANPAFPFYPELRALILKSVPHARGELISKLRGVGSVKLAVLSGAFVNDPAGRVDLLLVADRVRKPRLTALVRWLEGLVGRELNYVLLSSQEFRYRRNLFDHFLQDVLESPHEKLINKLGA